MLGAIIGDTVGSVFEFNNLRSKDFELFAEDSELTDDSIMTLAICECLLNREANNSEKIVAYLKKWGRTYPDRGYGGSFYRWLFNDNDKPYNSFGNGAAMRISAAGWFGRNEKEVRDLAYNLTAVTHNHPEGLKGAEVTAMCVYYARIGKSKEFIKDYVSKYYNLDFEYEDLKKNYHFNETCQETVPQAIYCFLISKDFEDCLRTTISIGGDCDTTAAISCAIAEAYYKHINPELVRKVLKRLPKPKNGCNPLGILIKFLGEKVYYNSVEEEISKDSFILSCEYIESSEKSIEFFTSKSLQALTEYLVFTHLDDIIGVPDDQASVDSLINLDLVDYFNWLKICYCRNEPFEQIEKIVTELIKCNDFDKYKELIESLNEHVAILNANHYVTYKYSIFENSEFAYKYLEDNYDIKNNVYTEVFKKVYKKEYEKYE